jgi:adenylate cyclase
MGCFIGIGISNNHDPYIAGIEAATSAKKGCDTPDIAIVFASIQYDQNKILQGISSIINKNIIFGCSSYAEISNVGISKNSVVVFLCSMEDSQFSFAHSDFEGQQKKIGKKLVEQIMQNPDEHKETLSLGLLFRTAGNPQEEQILETIQYYFPQLVIFGGMASGDYDVGMQDKNFWNSYIYERGNIRQKDIFLAHLALPKNNYHPAFAFEHGWGIIGPVVEFTKCHKNKIYEVNHIPIFDYFRQFLGGDSDELLLKSIYHYSFAVQIKDKNQYRTAIKAPVSLDYKNGYVSFYPFENFQGKKGQLAQPDRLHILDATKKAAVRCKESLGGIRPAFVFVVSCCVRGSLLNSKIDLELECIQEVFGKNVPIIGYHSGGELSPYHSKYEDIIDLNKPYSGSSFHGATICIMALGCKDPNISVSFPDEEYYRHQHESIDYYKNYLNKSEKLFDETQQFMLSMSRRNYIQGEKLQQQNEYLESQNTELQKTLNELDEKHKSLEKRNQFIQKTFGRYLSDQVVDQILETPEGLNLGGENRMVTLMMTDLRGFTSICERLDPKQVMAVINNYLGIMTNIILKYDGSINEFIGDAIMAIFGAPLEYKNHAEKAIACAIEMQTAMKEVNEKNLKLNLPEVEMGIGLNTTNIVVGNIGSEKRAKYGVVGSGVNLTSRIESYTTGGQILVSESTKNEVGDKLLVTGRIKIAPKGINEPISIYKIEGIGGDFNISLPEKQEAALVSLPHEIPIRFLVIRGKDAAGEMQQGTILKISKRKVVIACKNVTVEKFANIKCHFFSKQLEMIPGELYGKVIVPNSEDQHEFTINITSMPSEINAFISGLISIF